MLAVVHMLERMMMMMMMTTTMTSKQRFLIFLVVEICGCVKLSLGGPLIIFSLWHLCGFGFVQHAQQRASNAPDPK